jgi:hypothetical protein
MNAAKITFGFFFVASNHHFLNKFFGMVSSTKTKHLNILRCWVLKTVNNESKPLFTKNQLEGAH